MTKAITIAEKEARNADGRTIKAKFFSVGNEIFAEASVEGQATMLCGVNFAGGVDVTKGFDHVRQAIIDGTANVVLWPVIGPVTLTPDSAMED